MPNQMIRALLILPILFFSFSSQAQVPIELKCLWGAYKSFQISPDSRDIKFRNGAILPFQSREPIGTPVNRQNLTSIDQMFLIPYPRGFTAQPDGQLTYKVPSAREDLRGSRYFEFFYELYGRTPKHVEQNLVKVRWIDGSLLLFNSEYGAAAALQKVSQQLVTLLHTHPQFMKFLKQPIGGTYNWRNIAGENNISVHSFGIAIDINTTYANYWEWETGSDGIIHYHNSIPPEIVQVFEENGFMWGGKWYRYDTMHFEYRPEALMTAAECENEFLKYPFQPF